MKHKKRDVSSERQDTTADKISAKHYYRNILNCLKVFLKNTVRHIILGIADWVTIQYPISFLAPKIGLLKMIGIKIEGNIFADRGFRCFEPHNIWIEECVSMGHDNHIWAFCPVKIGRYTQTAKDLLIISGTHDICSFEGLPDHEQKVTIGAGCWIGARVTILGGSKIGKGCIVGAGSLVKGDFPDWSIIAGVPACVINERTPSSEITSPFGKYSPKDLEKGDSQI